MREMAKRGVLYVTGICNAQCSWCYYRFMKDKKHEPIDKLKQDLDRQKYYYNLDFTDLTGWGETTLHPKIDEIVKHCININLLPSVITNGLRPDIIERLFKLGLDDILLSIQGVGAVHDKAVSVPNAFKKVEETLKIAKDFRFRVNTTITKYNYEHLPELAEYFLSLDKLPLTANFIIFNPHEGMKEWAEKTAIEFQAKYTEIAPYLKKAIDILNKDVWVNVRYMPLCTMVGYEQHVCNFTHFQYDFLHEWDVVHGMNTSKERIPHLIEEANRLGIFGYDDNEKLHNILIRRLTHGNVIPEKCKGCRNLLICDGIYRQYARRFGVDEFNPVEGEKIKDPLFYRDNDRRWATWRKS